jgi:hypothetical protein
MMNFKAVLFIKKLIEVIEKVEARPLNPPQGDTSGIRIKVPLRGIYGGEYLEVMYFSGLLQLPQ